MSHQIENSHLIIKKEFLKKAVVATKRQEKSSSHTSDETINQFEDFLKVNE